MTFISGKNTGSRIIRYMSVMLVLCFFCGMLTACKNKHFQKKKIDAPAQNVTFPLETYPNGMVKSRLKAKKAYMFMDTGFIWGEGIRVEQYRPDGKTIEAFLTADNCIVDRKSKSGWVEGNAHMDWDGTSIKGRGIYFSFDREFIKIFSQTEIRTKALKLGAGKVFEK